MWLSRTEQNSSPMGMEKIQEMELKLRTISLVKRGPKGFTPPELSAMHLKKTLHFDLESKVTTKSRLEVIVVRSRI